MLIFEKEVTNEPDVYYKDDTWSMESVDLNEHGPKRNKVRENFL